MDIQKHDDLRLIDIESELFALEEHLNFSEEYLRNQEAFETTLSQEIIRKNDLTLSDPYWHVEQQKLDYIVDILLPRLFRGPFLVSLYAVYESAVTEIANLIQKQKEIGIPITEKNKNFNLDRAKKYYNDTIDF